MPELRSSLGYLYLQETKLRRETIGTRPKPRILTAEPFKRYPQAEKVLLPRSWDGEETNLWRLLQRRRSKRDYAAQGLGLTDLALLLWASQGVTAQAGSCYLRTAPSAGALYPIETYVAAERVEGVEPGLLHFDVKGFQLERLALGAPGRSVAKVSLGQTFVSRAAAVFIWSAVLRRNMTKYGHRGLRYVFMDAGHICQNLLLAAEAIGLAACPVGAFFDDELNALLELDGEEETVIYMACVGRRG
jgi:SagB-type dehydrogenase family enzyme